MAFVCGKNSVEISKWKIEGYKHLEITTLRAQIFNPQIKITVS